MNELFLYELSLDLFFWACMRKKNKNENFPFHIFNQSLFWKFGSIPTCITLSRLSMSLTSDFVWSLGWRGYLDMKNGMWGVGCLFKIYYVTSAASIGAISRQALKGSNHKILYLHRSILRLQKIACSSEMKGKIFFTEKKLFPTLVNLACWGTL